VTTDVYINSIASAVPRHEVHQKFIQHVSNSLGNERDRKLFQRLAAKSQIESRYSVVEPANEPGQLDSSGLYQKGAYASTAKRMQVYKSHAFEIASRAVRDLLAQNPKLHPREITHLVVTSCTGFYAPGLDLELQKEFGLSDNLERSVIGFMGCYAAFNALKVAYHAVRSKPESKVLVVNLELCTLHLREDFGLEQLLAFMQFADGCAVSLISSENRGLHVRALHSDVISSADDLITWHIEDSGFDMFLSPKVPHALSQHVPRLIENWLKEEWRKIPIWAIHPGGRAIIDAVQDRLELSDEMVHESRDVLRRYGNMSSATIMFVLKLILERADRRGEGVAMAFGPGLTMESMHFEKL